MLHYRKIVTAISFVAINLVAGCSSEVSIDDETVSGRWYTATQVKTGRGLFLSHCAACHGEIAAATTDWRTTNDAGDYPPPPLNGSAHAWHHPISVLEETIAVGGIPIGGVMPGFREILDDREARATIAYFQSLWSDEIYERWDEINSH